MTENKFNSSDDLENIKLLEKKLIERAGRICNRGHLIYIELKLKLIELAENPTTEKKLIFLLYLDDVNFSLEDVADLMPILFTHCITHLFIKKLLFELIEIRNDITQAEDVNKICEELKNYGCNVYMDIINDTKQPTTETPPQTKPKTKRKPRTKQPQTKQEKEQKKEIKKKLELVFN